ncbi:hypothetical protein STEG23_004269 [Scotinomys teguina]
MCDVDAITFPFVDVVLHLKVEVGAMYVGFCGKELEDILFFLLPDIKGSSHCVSCELLSSVSSLGVASQHGEKLLKYQVMCQVLIPLLGAP